MENENVRNGKCEEKKREKVGGEKNTQVEYYLFEKKKKKSVREVAVVPPRARRHFTGCRRGCCWRRRPAISFTLSMKASSLYLAPNQLAIYICTKISNRITFLTLFHSPPLFLFNLGMGFEGVEHNSR